MSKNGHDFGAIRFLFAAKAAPTNSAARINGLSYADRRHNNLMRKIMRALGMKTVDDNKELTQALMRDTMTQLMARTTIEAKKAIQKIN